MNILLAILFVILQGTDGILTTWGKNHGYQETNILMSNLAGNWWFAIAKILVFVPVLILIYIGIKRVSPKHPWVKVFTNVYLGLLVMIYLIIISLNILVLT